MVAKTKKGGRPKIWEQHKSYSYVDKRTGKTIHVKAHQEKRK